MPIVRKFRRSTTATSATSVTAAIATKSSHSSPITFSLLLFVSVSIIMSGNNVVASLAMKTATAAHTHTQKIAIIGGGVAGCSAARRLAQLLSSSSKQPLPSGERHSITIYEIGRGLGGRASTRKTRAIPHLGINHGAPYADITTTQGKQIMDSLLKTDATSSAAIQPFTGRRGTLILDHNNIDHKNRMIHDHDDDDDDYAFRHDHQKNHQRSPSLLRVTGKNGEMSNLASALLLSLDDDDDDDDSTAGSMIEMKYSSMVRGLSFCEEQKKWNLYDKDGISLGPQYDWLIVASSGIAHPRWTNTFGGEPPLVKEAKKMEQQQQQQQQQCDNNDNNNDHEHPLQLTRALEEIAKQTPSPVLAVMFYCTGTLAEQLLQLKYNVIDIVVQNDTKENNNGDEKSNHILSRIMIQKQSSGSSSSSGNSSKDKNNEVCLNTSSSNHRSSCSVVLHSTTQFALDNVGVYGSTSSAARIGDASSDAEKEQEIITKMMQALQEVLPLSPLPVYDHRDSYEYGPVLHRWGNAFPTRHHNNQNKESSSSSSSSSSFLLPQHLSVCPQSRVAFCGDYVQTEAVSGSIESALLSGTSVAEQILLS